MCYKIEARSFLSCKNLETRLGKPDWSGVDEDEDNKPMAYNL